MSRVALLALALVLAACRSGELGDADTLDHIPGESRDAGADGMAASTRAVPAAPSSERDAATSGGDADPVHADAEADADAAAPILDGPDAKRDCQTQLVSWVAHHTTPHQARLVTSLPAPSSRSTTYANEAVARAIELALERSQLQLVDRWPRTEEHECSAFVPTVAHYESFADRETSSLLLFSLREDPATGIDGVRLRLALALGHSNERPVHFVGPSYSASAVSIGREPAPDVPMELFAGGASSDALEALLEDVAHVHRLAARDSELEALLFEYLRESQAITCRDDVLEGVGLLRESGTGWGTLARQDEARARGCGADERPVAQVELAFPYLISELRRRWVDLERTERAHQAERGPEPVRELRRSARGLDALLEEDVTPGHAADVDHNLLRSLVAGLDRLLSEVARARVRYVGIQATDPADAVFLADRLHELAPDARAFVLGNDAIYSHHSSWDEMQGTYVVSTYPFLGTDDFWMRQRQRTHQTFMSDGAEATFNAMLFALSSLGLIPHDVPATELRFCRPDQPGQLDGMPVWLGVIGADGFDPIWLGTARDGALVASECTLELDPEVVPPNLWLVLVLLVGLGLEVDRRRVTRLLHKLEKAKTTTFVAHLYALAFFSRAIWWGTAMWVGAVHLLAMINAFCNSDRMVAAGVAIFMAALPRAYSYVRNRDARGRHATLLRARKLALGDAGAPQRSVVYTAAIVWCAIAALDVAWIATEVGSVHSEAPLFALRVLALTSGMSPAVPLLLTFFATWLLVWCSTGVLVELRRLTWATKLSDLVSPGIVDETADEDAAAASPNLETLNVGTAERQLRSRVDPAVSLRTRAVLVATVLIPPALIAAFVKHPSSLEPRLVGWLLGANVLFALVLVLFLVAQLYDYERGLMTLLGAIARRPVAGALHLLPLPFAWTVDSILSGPRAGDQRKNVTRELLQIGDDESVWKATAEHAPALARLRLREPEEAPDDKHPFRSPSLVPPPPASTAPQPSTETRPTPPRRDGYPKLATESGEGSRPISDELLAVAALSSIMITRYVGIVRHYFVALTLAGLCLLATMSVYPFEPRRYFLLCAWVVLGTIAIISLRAIVDLDRSTVLSSLGRTPPGRLTLNTAFLVRVFTYGVIPLVSLLASQYPELARWMFEIFDPLLRVLR